MLVLLKVHASLLEHGGLVLCPESPCNTPILPVRKASGDCRFVQDLRPVNEAVFCRAPVVPNPTWLLSAVPATAKWFPVIDLANVFLGIPVAPESQFRFAFTFFGKSYTESLAISLATLAQHLKRFIFPAGSTLIKYVDDLLLCSETLEACETDTQTLLTFLAENHQKVSKNKLQTPKL